MSGYCYDYTDWVGGFIACKRAAYYVIRRNTINREVGSVIDQIDNYCAI